MKTSHRSLFVAVISLLLALNNGAFLALTVATSFGNATGGGGIR